MAFQIIDPPIPPRHPALLIEARVAVPNQLTPLGAEPETYIPYDEVAPGLYPDEHVARLDTGEMIAISVSTARLPNGAGMLFHGCARVIEEDGSTKRDKAGAEMELQCKHPVSAASVQALETSEESAQARITREIILMMLGEPPTMRKLDVDPNARVVEVAVDQMDWERSQRTDAPKAPPGTVLDHSATEAPVIGWSDEVRLNHSIRHAIELADRAEPAVDIATLLRA